VTDQLEKLIEVDLVRFQPGSSRYFEVSERVSDID